LKEKTDGMVFTFRNISIKRKEALERKHFIMNKPGTCNDFECNRNGKTGKVIFEIS